MKKSILIFDDDPEILSVCKIILEKKSYKIETRTYCDNIIKDISTVKPNLVLMDLWMPGMGGENATKLMKTSNATQNIPVVIFSANGKIEEIYNRLNANGFLIKPFEIKALINIVEKNIL